MCPVYTRLRIGSHGKTPRRRKTAQNSRLVYKEEEYVSSIKRTGTCR